jgi:hypothetical protein
VPGNGGRKDVTEDVLDEEAPGEISDDMAGTEIESSGGPTWSSTPSSSALMTPSTCVADKEDELLGSKEWVPRGCVPGMKLCIL